MQGGVSYRLLASMIVAGLIGYVALGSIYSGTDVRLPFGGDQTFNGESVRSLLSLLISLAPLLGKFAGPIVDKIKDWIASIGPSPSPDPLKPLEDTEIKALLAELLNAMKDCREHLAALRQLEESKPK